MTGDANTVLVLTAAEDETADAVTGELRRRSVPFTRLDIGGFPTRLTLAAVHDGAGWRTRLRTRDGTTVDLDAVRSVYYRRPTRFAMPPGMSDGDRVFALAEARLGFGGVLAALDARWVNDPTRAALAEYKPVQLKVAAQAGLAVPRTLVTNDHDELLAFAAGLDGPLVCKTFSSLVLSEDGVAQAIYTTPVDPADIDPTRLALTAHLFQEWVAKAYEVRVTIVGRTPFAAGIHADSAAGRVDWRSDYPSLRYEVVEPPPDVLAGMLRYLDAFGLNYGAFDAVVQPDGTWRVLECNPAGQWLWLEHRVGLPIAAALAELLAEGADR